MRKWHNLQSRGYSCVEKKISRVRSCGNDINLSLAEILAMKKNCSISRLFTCIWSQYSNTIYLAFVHAEMTQSTVSWIFSRRKKKLSHIRSCGNQINLSLVEILAIKKLLFLAFVQAHLISVQSLSCLPCIDCLVEDVAVWARCDDHPVWWLHPSDHEDYYLPSSPVVSLCTICWDSLCALSA